MIENLKISDSKKIEIKKICSSMDGQNVLISGFIQHIKVTKKYAFIILRDYDETLQCIVDVGKENLKDVVKLNKESYVEFVGCLHKTNMPIKSCSKSDVELEVTDIGNLSKAEQILPFSYKDISSTLEERNQNKTIANVGFNICLDNKSLYLRSPLPRSIFKIVDGIMYGFRDFLRKNDFIEIRSPKLIECASEGGANVFAVDYYKGKAFLAQSPQLYKQMAIIGGLKRVYEIGSVYRAEESNINRYLSEFSGLDLEMEIQTDYVGVIRFIYSTLKNIFDLLKNSYQKELEIIKKFHPYEDFKYGEKPIILTHRECIDLLKNEGVNIGYDDDFNNENEKKLGGIIKTLHGVDIFVIKDYPVSARPFYTYVDRDSNLTRSYDFIIRGEEILSGAQRINNYEELMKKVKDHGIDPKTLGGYLEAFKYGAPPHGGAGIGLERLAKAYFGMSDVRHFSLFPRDQFRLYP